MFIKTRASCLCLMILILLVGHKSTFADPLLSASPQDLVKLGLGLKPGEPKDEPVYIEPIPCATWLYYVYHVYDVVDQNLKWESRENARVIAYNAYLDGIINGQKLPPTSTQYLMFKNAIDDSLAGVDLSEAKANVLDICNRYENEYVTFTGGRSADPNPRFKGAGKRQ